VLCCFSDTGPVLAESVSLAGVRETFTEDTGPVLAESVSLAGVRETFTEADLLPESDQR
jgi:hypothetical protein